MLKMPHELGLSYRNSSPNHYDRFNKDFVKILIDNHATKRNDRLTHMKHV